MEDWDRRERAQRELERVKKMDRKARDSRNGECVNGRDGKQTAAITKPEKSRQTQNPVVQKPGRWPRKQRQPMTGVPLAEAAPETLREDEEKPRGKGKTQGLTLYKAKKKWTDSRKE